MKVYLISQPEEFDLNHIKMLEKYCDVEWIKCKKFLNRDFRDISSFEDKIIALSPVPFDWNIPDEFYPFFTSVRYLCLATTSYDYINVKALRKKQVVITNVPYYSTNAVAEYAIWMMFCILKKLPVQIRTNFKYQFTRENLMSELTGKKVGIIGLGHIGERIANLLSGIGMDINYWSPSKKQNKYKYLELKELLKISDIVFPAFELNAQSKKLLTLDNLKLLGKNSYFVNIVGEEVCDTKYLIKRAESGELGGLAFESQQYNKPASIKGNVFVTSPMAWYTKESLKNNMDIWANTIISCVKGKPVNVVN